MKTVCMVLGFIILSSGCSGIQIAKNSHESVQIYGSDCAEYQEGSKPHAECILQSWKMAEERERLRQERKEMLKLIRANHKDI
jgi:hypothetical protein